MTDPTLAHRHTRDLQHDLKPLDGAGRSRSRRFSWSESQPSLLPGEEWRPIAGYEGFYEVSNCGRVRRLSRCQTARKRHAPKLLKPGRCDGYPQVTLDRDGVRVSRPIHILVALAFIGPRPAGTQVAHRNGDRSNPRLDNLRYATPLENSADMRLHGTVMEGELHHKAKLTEADVIAMREAAREGISFAELARQYDICPTTAARIARGKLWACLNDRCAPITNFAGVASGSRHGAAKLNEADVREICRSLKDGETAAAIARRYGVTISTVALIRDGQTWRHVTGGEAIPSRPRSRCRRGHEWTPENTGITRSGARFCRICDRASKAARTARLVDLKAVRA